MSFKDDNASIEGVFRDVDGQWLYDYSLKVSKETIFRIEARAILEGLHISWEKGYRQLEIKCDNALLVESFLAGNAANRNLAELRLINGYLNKNWKIKIRHKDWKIKIRHIPRSQNMAIDQMTKCIYDNPFGPDAFREPPNFSSRDLTV